MQAGAKRRYNRGDVQVISNHDEDSAQVHAMLSDETTSNLLAVASRRAKNVADFDKNAKRRLAEKLAGLVAVQQRRDSRIVQMTAMASRLEEKWRRLYLQRVEHLRMPLFQKQWALSLSLENNSGNIVLSLPHLSQKNQSRP